MATIETRPDASVSFHPADTASMAITPADFARGGSLRLSFLLTNDLPAVLHVRIAPESDWVKVFPSEVGLARGEKQSVVVMVDLHAARAAVLSGAAPSGPIALNYQFVHGSLDARPGQIPQNGVATTYVRLPVATCPSCQKVLDATLSDRIALPEFCPSCYERLRPCPICGQANTWLARVCAADSRHILIHGPDWTGLGGDATHQGVRSGVAGSLVRKWSYPSSPATSLNNEMAFSAPVAAHNIVVAAAALPNGDAFLLALDIRNGAPIWDPYPLPDPVYPERGGATICGANVVAATVEGAVVSVDLLRGTRNWQSELGLKVYASAVSVGPDGPLLFTGNTKDNDGFAVAVSSETGDVLWRSALSGTCDSAAASDGERAFVTDDSGAIHAFSLADGSLLWRGAQSAGFDAAPVFFDGKLFCASEDGRVGAYDASSGAVLWTVSATDARVGTSPAVDSTLLAVAADDGVHFLATTTGRAVRRFSLRRPVRSAPILRNDSVVFCVTDGSVCLASPAAPLERLYEIGTTGAQFVAAPAQYEGVLFAVSTNGVLYALASQTPTTQAMGGSGAVNVTGV